MVGCRREGAAYRSGAQSSFLSSRHIQRLVEGATTTSPSIIEGNKAATAIRCASARSRRSSEGPSLRPLESWAASFEPYDKGQLDSSANVCNYTSVVRGTGRQLTVPLQSYREIDLAFPSCNLAWTSFQTSAAPMFPVLESRR
jgi:hypothetical protein